MNHIDHLHAIARRYPGGVEALAHRLGKSPNTLRHEFAGQGTAKLGAADADAILAVCVAAGVPGALEPLHAQAAAHNAMLLLLPQGEGAQRTGALEDVAACAAEFADFVGAVATAAADGRVSANELDQVDKELAELIARVHNARQHLAQIHEASKPRAHAAAGAKGALAV